MCQWREKCIWYKKLSIKDYIDSFSIKTFKRKLRTMNPSLHIIHPNRKICEIHKVLGSFGEVQSFFALRSHTIDTFRVSMKMQMKDSRISCTDIFCDPLSLLVSSVSSNRGSKSCLRELSGEIVINQKMIGKWIRINLMKFPRTLFRSS